MTYMDSDPIGAALTESICIVSPILRECRCADGNNAIGRQFVRVEKLSSLRIQACLLVQHTSIQQTSTD